jgi:hypothetical protein
MALMISLSLLDLEGVFGMSPTTPWTNRVFTCNSVGRHVADASLFAAVVNILAVFRLEGAPGWSTGLDGEDVKWTGGITT